jgi:esterase/lipase superfamily enzyme
VPIDTIGGVLRRIDAVCLVDSTAGSFSVTLHCPEPKTYCIRSLAMNGVLRYGKSIVTSLTIALLALACRYGEAWLFPSVEDPDPTTGIVLVDKYAQTSRSHSPMRSLTSNGESNWKIAVVTNRAPAAASSQDNTGTRNTQFPRTLVQQAQDAVFATPKTTFGFTSVTLPTVRNRGECPVDGDRGNPVTIDTPQYGSDEQFFEALSACTDNAEAKDVFVFVHGFNVTTEQALARAAQVAEDMPFHGVVVAFSWGSLGRGEAYLIDELRAEHFFWNLAELLANLRSRLSDDVRLHVLAHSMGNRVTLRALNALTGTIGPTGLPVDPSVTAELSQITAGQLTDQQQDTSAGASKSLTHGFRISGLHGMEEIKTRFPRWGTWTEQRLSTPALANLILAAPDVDTNEFDVLAGNIRHVAGKITLYASDTDFALEASKKVHGGAFRAGDSRATVSVAGLNTVRVSGVSADDPLGHSYYGSNPTVLTQLSRPWTSDPAVVVFGENGRRDFQLTNEARR